MELNDKIFESIKNALNNDIGDENDEELFLKICTGTATEEEKKEYQELSGLDEDTTKQLTEYCKIGQKMAAQFENKNPLEEKLDFIIEELKEIKEILKPFKEEKLNKNGED
jgi:actin-like ATPase involved in cell morphogenesis